MAIETVTSTDAFKQLVTEVTSQAGYREPMAFGIARVDRKTLRKYFRQTSDSLTGKRTLVLLLCSSKHLKRQNAL